MLTFALIGFVGGLITGVSPCILPVLPVIFFTGAQGGADDAVPQPFSGADGDAAARPRRTSRNARPYLVVGGLVVSFTAVTLVGSTLLSLVHLPQDAIRWAALAAVVAIGLGLIFPRVEQLLERPFARIPQRQFGFGGDGFGLGLALGALYVPCAGPVLAAIVVAGATAPLGPRTVVLTATFALGAALPLLVFALAIDARVRPEIDQHHLAAQGRKRDRLAAGGVQPTGDALEIGCGAAAFELAAAVAAIRQLRVLLVDDPAEVELLPDLAVGGQLLLQPAGVIGNDPLQDRGNVEHQSHREHDHHDPGRDADLPLPPPKRSDPLSHPMAGQRENQQGQRGAQREGGGQHDGARAE
ncbi:cytochrome c biogenesis CcdA family protein, partial [Mycobacterium scrofulaceum]|uniref:cytochrome c biogenesis CcdA family protein n=1 Tax=Mycobacterium scrofulaceum TaxID=1783 RepID=UPI0018D4075C